MRGRAMARVFSLAAFLAAAGARADFFSVVRITDLRGNAKFQVCTGAERQKLAAELSAEEKNAVSHRKRALEALQAILREERV